MSKTEEMFGVAGITCGRCESDIKRAVGALAGVDEVDIDVRSKLVTVKFDAAQVDTGKIKETIEEQGFDVK